MYQQFIYANSTALIIHSCSTVICMSAVTSVASIQNHFPIFCLDGLGSLAGSFSELINSVIMNLTDS
jgi:hypothetical protein